MATELGLTENDLWAPLDGPKRILTIEGGGVRGVFSLQILKRMEEMLREHYKRPELVLANHFHLIAGTSVGAIVATFLSWGWSVEKLCDLFDQTLKQIFSMSWKIWRGAYQRGPLREILQGQFTEGEGEPALLGTRRLKSWLLIVLRNLSTGSAWPLLNHPESKYNKLKLSDGSDNLASNLRIPLWQLVRGSTAAPVFFAPERVEIAPGKTVEFIDGGITAYNNPSVIAFLMATLPRFPLQWEKGVDKLQVVSVGTGRSRALLTPLQRKGLGQVGLLGAVPGSLIESAGLEQDLIMRAMGHCVIGPEIDREMGPLAGEEAVGDAFRYCRYTTDFTPAEIKEVCQEYRTRFSLSAVKLAPWLKQRGREYAAGKLKADGTVETPGAVKIEHLI